MRRPIAVVAAIAWSFACRPAPPPSETRPPTSSAAPAEPEPEPASEPAPPEPEPPEPGPEPPRIPEPDGDLAALPTDVRLPDRAAWEKHYRKDCRALAASPCELSADLDADGLVDRVVETRAIRSKLAGFSVLWGRGGVSVIGAGAPSRQLHTDVHVDGVDLSWSETEDDFAFLEVWAIVPRTAPGGPHGGFDTGRPAGPPRPGGRSGTLRLAAPDATGAGIWLDGGDAAEVLYWDGALWRRLIVGF